MTDEAALFGAILAAPADDTVRLAYADWLQENGRPERAEFVRVQIELHALTRPRPDEPYHADTQWPEWKRFTSETDPARCARVQLLRTREADLLWPPERDPQWFPPGWLVRLDRDPKHYGVKTLFVARGFVCRVCCPASEWDEKGDALRTAHPITAVRMTTDGDEFWAALRVRSRSDPGVVGMVEELLRHFRIRWPGVSFELPPLE